MFPGQNTESCIVITKKRLCHSVISAVQMILVDSQAQSSPVTWVGWIFLMHRMAVMDWMGLVRTDPFTHIIFTVIFCQALPKHNPSSLYMITYPRMPTVIKIVTTESVYSAPSRDIFRIKTLTTVKVDPDLGHCEGSVQTKPSPDCQSLGSVQSQSKNLLDLTWTGLINCWAGGIIAATA